MNQPSDEKNDKETEELVDKWMLNVEKSKPVPVGTGKAAADSPDWWKPEEVNAEVESAISNFRLSGTALAYLGDEPSPKAAVNDIIFELGDILWVRRFRSWLERWIQREVFRRQRKQFRQPPKDRAIDRRLAITQSQNPRDVGFEKRTLLPSTQRCFHIGIYGWRAYLSKKIRGTASEGVDQERCEQPFSARFY